MEELSRANSINQNFKPLIIPTKLANVSVLLRSGEDLEHEQVLGFDYIVNPQDVICVKRGCKESSVIHTGNERFKVIIAMNVVRYKKTKNRVNKNEIIREVVDIVRQGGGKFIQRDLHGVWYDVGNVRGREKARMLLRRPSDTASETLKVSMIDKKSIRRVSFEVDEDRSSTCTMDLSQSFDSDMRPQVSFGTYSNERSDQLNTSSLKQQFVQHQQKDRQGCPQMRIQEQLKSQCLLLSDSSNTFFNMESYTACNSMPNHRIGMVVSQDHIDIVHSKSPSNQYP